jgi:ATP-dependent DNA ligase
MTTHKPLPTLYVRKATGKTQEWSIYIVENAHNNVELCMEYGEVNGKKIVKRKPIKSTKAKRTLLDEAIKQSETKYNEKINKEGYSTNANVMSSAVVIRPMLANKYDPNKTKLDIPCEAEPKCDGNRGIIFRENGEIKIVSRNGTEIYFFDHIRNEMDDFLKDRPDTFYVDGEIFTHDLTFNVINGLCNKKPSKQKKISKKQEEKYAKDAIYMSKVKYYIFDCFDTDHLNMSLKVRKTILKKMFENKNYQHLILIDSCIINNESEIKIKHNEYVNNGYEGIILRNLDSPYELKKRSKYLLKYKEFEDEEFDIVGYESDVDGGVIWICDTNISPKSTFNVRPRGDMDHRKEMLLRADKYVGAKLIVVYQEYTDNVHGIPRFPVGKDFRNVKDLD